MPESELSAPRVAGRDFVTEHLRLEQAVPERSLEVARKLEADLRIKVEIGTISPTDLGEVRSRIVKLEAAVESVQRKIAARREFLAGRLDGPTVQLHGVEIEMQQRIKALQPQVEQSVAETLRVAKQVEVGLLPPKASVEAKLRQLELETELSKAELELALVRERIRRQEDASR